MDVTALNDRQGGRAIQLHRPPGVYLYLKLKISIQFHSICQIFITCNLIVV